MYPVPIHSHSNLSKTDFVGETIEKATEGVVCQDLPRVRLKPSESLELYINKNNVVLCPAVYAPWWTWLVMRPSKWQNLCCLDDGSFLRTSICFCCQKCFSITWRNYLLDYLGLVLLCHLNPKPWYSCCNELLFIPLYELNLVTICLYEIGRL